VARAVGIIEINNYEVEILQTLFKNNISQTLYILTFKTSLLLPILYNFFGEVGVFILIVVVKYLQVSISSIFYTKLLQDKIPKAQKRLMT